MSEQLTPEHRPFDVDFWRDVAVGAKERGLDGVMVPLKALHKALDEIERLRRERDTLDSGLDGLEQAIHYQDWPAVVAFLRAARRLLDGEKGGGGERA